MGVEVIVITNGSDFGERLLRLTWGVAQKLFKEYGIEVYVIPYQVKGSRVSLVVNGLEFPVIKMPTPEEIQDIILSAVSEGVSEINEIAFGTLMDEEGGMGEGALIIT